MLWLSRDIYAHVCTLLSLFVLSFETRFRLWHAYQKKAFISITITQHLRKIIILYYTLTTHAQGSHTVLRMSFIVAATVIFYFKLQSKLDAYVAFNYYCSLFYGLSVLLLSTWWANNSLLLEGEGHPLHCTMFNRITGLHPIDVNKTTLYPSL